MSRRGLRQDAVGCFEASFPTFPRWSLVAPRRFRLEAAAIGSGVYSARFYDRSFVNYEEKTEAVWTADSLTDSIRFVISDGFSGEEVSFALSQSDTLRGFVSKFGDVTPAHSIGSAVVRRVDCLKDSSLFSSPT